MFPVNMDRGSARSIPPRVQREESYPHAHESGWTFRALEAARHAADDLELAREAQARLFPRRLPALKSLSYAVVSIPAHEVGGDYFDLVDLGRGHVGLAVGDVAGKGVAAALQMANLQASLRSRCALAVDDLGILLRSVNRLFLESIPEASYATLFFAEYCDRERRLRYVNCGHPAPLLLRTDGTVERLRATATVLGILEDWDCAVGEVRLARGDTLMVYTDGVTEATNEAGEEFGEQRLIELLSAHNALPASALLRTIAGAARQFAGNEDRDDITLVAARCRRMEHIQHRGAKYDFSACRESKGEGTFLMKRLSIAGSSNVVLMPGGKGK